jgi:hypothetical protein
VSRDGLFILTHGLILDHQLYLPALQAPGNEANNLKRRPTQAPE